MHELVDLVRVGVGAGVIVGVGLELGTELGEGESRGKRWGSRLGLAVWGTAYGAAGWSGWAAVCSARSALILVSHSSSSSLGRALSAGKEPMMPACVHTERRHGASTSARMRAQE